MERKQPKQINQHKLGPLGCLEPKNRKDLVYVAGQGGQGCTASLACYLPVAAENNENGVRTRH